MHLDLFGPKAVFDHVGIGMKSIEEALPGLARVTDPIQRVTVGFVDLHGIAVEAIEPASEDAPIGKLLERGHKLLHLCFRVPDLERAVRAARERGLLPISNPVPAVAFDGRRIAWVFSRTLGLFELVEAEQRG